MMRVTFTEWRDGFPQRIELYEAGESAVSPQRVPPMHWDAKANAYVWPVAPQR